MKVLFFLTSIPFFVGLILSPSSAQLANSPWPMFHHDARSTGRSIYVGPESPVLKWKYKTGDDVSSPVIGSDGTIYVGSDDGYLYALNPKGKLKWKFKANGEVYFIAVGVGDVVYSGSRDGNVYAVNSDGTQRWRFDAGIDLESPPVISPDGTIYIGSHDIYLFAINPDGTEKWHFEAEDKVSYPALGLEGEIYFGCDNGYFYALNPDGSLKWKSEFLVNPCNNPSVGADGTIYFGTCMGSFNALDKYGTMKWYYTIKNAMTRGTIIGAPTIDKDNNIYFGSYAPPYDDRWSSGIYSFTPDGEENWYRWLEWGTLSAFAIDANNTIFYGSGYSVRGYNPDASIEWYFSTDASLEDMSPSPALGKDGTIYFGSEDNNLYAIGDRTLGVRIYANQETYYFDDTMEISVQLSNPEKELIDLYAAILLGGTFYFFPDWGKTPAPNEFEADNWEETIISLQCEKDKIPVGDYTFYVVITEHDKYNVIDSDMQKIKVIGEKPEENLKLICEEEWIHYQGYEATYGPTCSGEGYSYTIVILTDSRCSRSGYQGRNPVLINGYVRDDLNDEKYYFMMDGRPYEITIDFGSLHKCVVNYKKSGREDNRDYATGEFKIYEYIN